MSLLTVCFSLYSLISNLIISLLPRFTSSFNTLHNSVFPTPVGPTNKNDAIGFPSSLTPAFALLTALLTVFIASLCPIIFLLNVSSSLDNLSNSSSDKLFISTPDNLDIVLNTSSIPTTFLPCNLT